MENSCNKNAYEKRAHSFFFIASLDSTSLFHSKVLRIILINFHIRLQIAMKVKLRVPDEWSYAIWRQKPSGGSFHQCAEFFFSSDSGILWQTAGTVSISLFQFCIPSVSGSTMIRARIHIGPPIRRERWCRKTVSITNG